MGRIRILTLCCILSAVSSGATANEASDCSLLVRPEFSKWSDERLIAQTRKNLKYLQKIPHKYTDLYVNGRVVIRGFAGPEARLAFRPLSSEETGKLVFRHYTVPGALAVIRAAKRIRAGPVAYVHSPFIYTDITGIFLTTPHYSQEAVGLDSKVHTAWVDLRLDPRIAVISLEPGIYVIPGSPPIPKWMLQGGGAPDHRAMGWSAMEIPIKALEPK